MSTNNGKLDLEETVDGIARDARERVNEVTSQAQDDLIDIQVQMRDLRRELVSRAQGVKDRAVAELQAAAARIRREAESVEDAEAAQKAEDLAAELEHTASRLSRARMDEITQGVTSTARENVWKTVLTAFVMGLAIGIVIGANRD
jgi:ElaB/YqjD/DUF883 family membrane-anchored ribosome-binding protein